MLRLLSYYVWFYLREVELRCVHIMAGASAGEWFYWRV